LMLLPSKNIASVSACSLLREVCLLVELFFVPQE